MLRALLSMLVIVGVGLALLWLRPSIVNDAPDPVETAAPASSVVAQPSSQRTPRVQNARPIAPEVVAVPRIDGGELVRQEARLPLSPLGAAPDPANMPPRETVLHRPVALAAGLVQAQGHDIALAGIETVDPEEMCDHEGRQWPCGAHARTAFRNFLRARALSCIVPATPLRETLTVKCTVAGADPALWLAENGWVREGAAEYGDAIDEARAAQRGLFGPPPGG
ncbi:thermonuclease family protein [Chelativorans sp. ZYF759]|uniref:thermonuclease family protein n=1 Tax=Chelativorans sp. ZYF759 TaxID=2692213 RepID=UPI00145CF37B|nr:thermonuclease family protein [Chelativorans sp. ZYF759]NMG41056.1 thermonuclease family protein [Chelativorans sp. ZYF759]